MSSPRGLCDRDRWRARVKRGKMTGAISLSFSLWPFRMMMMSMCVSACLKERVRKRRESKEQKRERGSPWGLINQACIVQEAPGGSCVGRQVSIVFWGRGYSQMYQSLHTTHTHTGAHTGAGLKLTRDKTHFLLLYFITMSRPSASYLVSF